MIDIKYRDKYEVAETAGQSVADVRKQYQEEFEMTGKTAAFLNGKKISASNENSTVLNDKDSLVFKKTGNRSLLFLAGALLLAAAITGGIFAYGFTNASTTILGTTQSSNFADVTTNNTAPVSWTVHGLQKGNTGSGTLFDINTATSGYPGDFTVTVSLANMDDLFKVYRYLALKLEMFDSSNNLVDINQDGVANSNDFTVLTIDNGSVTMPVKQTVPGVYTIKVVSGSYIANAGESSWTPTSGAPMLYCEVAQR